MSRNKDRDWSKDFPDPLQWQPHVQIAVLLDLRDELKALNQKFATLPCIPGLLRSIERQLKLQRRCPIHPRYTGIREPKTDCRYCRRYYKARWQ